MAVHTLDGVTIYNIRTMSSLPTGALTIAVLPGPTRVGISDDPAFANGHGHLPDNGVFAVPYGENWYIRGMARVEIKLTTEVPVVYPSKPDPAPPTPTKGDKGDKGDTGERGESGSGGEELPPPSCVWAYNHGQRYNAPNLPPPTQVRYDATEVDLVGDSMGWSLAKPSGFGQLWRTAVRVNMQLGSNDFAVFDYPRTLEQFDTPWLGQRVELYMRWLVAPPSPTGIVYFPDADDASQSIGKALGGDLKGWAATIPAEPPGGMNLWVCTAFLRMPASNSQSLPLSFGAAALLAPQRGSGTQGPQGIQGIQGVPGVKGDTGAITAPMARLCAIVQGGDGVTPRAVPVSATGWPTSLTEQQAYKTDSVVSAVGPTTPGSGTPTITTAIAGNYLVEFTLDMGGTSSQGTLSAGLLTGATKHCTLPFLVYSTTQLGVTVRKVAALPAATMSLYLANTNSASGIYRYAMKLTYLP